MDFKNEILSLFKAKVTRLEPYQDQLGNTHYFVYATVHSNFVGEGDLNEFLVEFTSQLPSLDDGTYASSVPLVGQVFLAAYDRIFDKVYFVAYVDSVFNRLLMSSDEDEPGSYKLVFGGTSGSSILLKQNYFSFNAGNNNQFLLDGRVNKLSISSGIFNVTYDSLLYKQFKLNNVDYYFTEKYIGSGKFHINATDLGRMAEHTLEPSLNIDPKESVNYVDKVSFRYGSILNKDGTDRESYVYEFDTRQATLSPITKDTVTYHRYGYHIYKDGASVPQSFDGAYESFTAKRLLAPPVGNIADIYSSIRGFTSESSVISHEQFLNKKFINPNPVDMFDINGNHYDLLFVDSELDYKNLNNIFSTIAEFGYFNSKARSLHDKGYLSRTLYVDASSIFFEERSFNRSRLFTRYVFTEENSQEFLETLEGNTYQLKLTVGDKVYSIIFSDSGINIAFDTGDEDTSPSIDLTQSKIVINPGTGENEAKVEITSNGVTHKLVTEEWIKDVFENHMHPTAGQGPPSKPIKLPVISTTEQSSHTTYVVNAQ